MEKQTKMKITNEGVYQSGVKGITWEKNIDTWRAAITVDGINYVLGFNPILEELIPIMNRARAMKEKGTEAFLDFYENEIGRTKRVVVPCPYQSDVSGVSYNIRSQRWIAAISVENKKYVMGTFEQQIEAEELRQEADVIKSRCENTPTESGIIDYSELYKFLEKLRIEKQQSRLDARIGKGHGRKAWSRLKKEESKLDALLLKSIKGELVKELKGYNKTKKDNACVPVKDYPTIRRAGTYYYVFLEKDGKEYYIGKSFDIMKAILLYEMGYSKSNSENWTSWYEEETLMGTKEVSIEEILDYFDLSMEKFNKYKMMLSGFSSTYSCKNVDKLGDNICVAYRDYRNVIKDKPISDKARVVYQGVAYVMVSDTRLPINGVSVMIGANERVPSIDCLVEDLYNVDEAKENLSTSSFWTWYLFESGIFANVETEDEETIA